MPNDDSSRNRIEKREAQARIDDEQKRYYHDPAGVSELQGVGYYDAEAALSSK